MNSKSGQDILDKLLISSRDNDASSLQNNSNGNEIVLSEWQTFLETATKESGDGKNQSIIILVMDIVQALATKISSLGSVVDAESSENFKNVVNEDRKQLIRILTVTCSNGKLIEVLSAVITSLSKDRKQHDELGKLLTSLEVVCSEVLEKIPLLGKDVFLNLICQCMGVIATTASLTTSQPSLFVKYTTLQQKIQDINQQLFEDEDKKKVDKFSDYDDLLVPPEDFREIPVVPTLQEFLCGEKPFLRANKVVGSYRNSEHYLDVQFRLLREDFVRPLRKAVQEFMKNKDEFIRTCGRKRANREQDSGARVYTDIAFNRMEMSKDNSQEYLFNLPPRLVNKVKWDKSKRLLPGCLVMLTSDYCKTAIFAITLVPPFEPQKKESGDGRRRELANGILRLSVETGSESELVDAEKSYIMFECEAFFEAYKHNLRILQSLLCLENDGPETNSLNKFIVKASPDVGYPLYFTNTELEFKLPVDKKKDIKGEEGEIFYDEIQEYYDHRDGLYVSPFVPATKWPAADIQKMMSLDPDQYEAFQTALTSELAVIQGPPGTGKTYVGLQIVKTLLLNRMEDIVPHSPILVLCYTNHALDQFLELLLHELPELVVVRAGGQSKSAALEAHTLARHRKQLQWQRDTISYKKFVRKQKEVESDALGMVKSLEHIVEGLKSEIVELSRPSGLFKFASLIVGKRLSKIVPDFVWDIIKQSEWLGVRDKNFLVPNFHVGEIVSHLFVVKQKPKTVAQNNNQLSNENVQIQNKSIERSNADTEEKMVTGEDEQEDGEYDMDELLEQRIIERDSYWETHETATSFSSFGVVYIEKCSIRECMRQTATTISNLKSRYNEYYSLEETEKYRNQDQKKLELRYSELVKQLQQLEVRKVEYENRSNLFAAIFRLYKEGRLELPNVDKVFHPNENGVRYVMESRDFIKYPIRLKWGIYFKLVEIALKLARDYQSEAEIQLIHARKKYTEERDKLDGCILRSGDIIGMTTTGAAKMHSLLEFAKPEIVIVEEAAEILEAHIVTSLTEDCKHLILIGDHLQLRPSANIFELWKKYRLNVSLFERMILNGIPLCTLKTQHRMRPEISNLIIGPIYKELYNHDNVYKYPSVKGIKKSIFFINHHELEETDTDLMSKSNYYEADFLVGLCEYLLKQGYEHTQITILTTYTGQMFQLRKINTMCRGVRITCVDNYQGEENDIILLSLVRSNEEDKVGFVGVDNRICVALSRARHGMYVVGNMDGMVNASRTWRKIHNKLKEGEDVGSALELLCERHGTITQVKTGNDFYPLKLGGCSQNCDFLLPCTHLCPQICHAMDQEHTSFQCKERCLKKCVLGHQCFAACSKECPKCYVLVKKTLPCKHKEDIACFKDVASVTCRALVTKQLNCQFQHKLEMECCLDATTIQCKVPVEKVLPCGHVRFVECDVSPRDVKCDFKDEKTLGCGHSKVLECHQSFDDVKCNVRVDKLMKCGHSKNSQCCVPEDKLECIEMVEKELFCGHREIMKCSKSVMNVKCNLMVDVVINGCSHVRKMHCFMSTNPKCEEKCDKILPCKHVCRLDCHATKDPNHKTYQCNEKCQRSCSSGHPCGYSHKCFQKCLPCLLLVTISLKCGHEAKIECSKNDGLYKCHEKVKKMLPCGHEQLVLCHISPDKHSCTFHIANCQKKCSFGHPCSFEHACNEGCPPCEEKVDKTLPCGHCALLNCHDEGSKYKCLVTVEKKLSCEHFQDAHCCKDPGDILCSKNVKVKCGRCAVEFFTECYKTSPICEKCMKKPAFIPPHRREKNCFVGREPGAGLGDRGRGTGLRERGVGLGDRGRGTGLRGRGVGLGDRGRGVGLGDRGRGSGLGDRGWRVGLGDRGRGAVFVDRERGRKTGYKGRGRIF